MLTSIGYGAYRDDEASTRKPAVLHANKEVE
jgi:hypothetical protein